jgi:hypothetical protein
MSQSTGLRTVALQMFESARPGMRPNNVFLPTMGEKFPPQGKGKKRVLRYLQILAGVK